MLQDTCDEAHALLGELLLPIGIVKDVFAALEEGHIGMHTGAVDSEDGLRHEGGVEPVLLGQGLHRQLKGHDIVGGL